MYLTDQQFHQVILKKSLLSDSQIFESAMDLLTAYQKLPGHSEVSDIENKTKELTISSDDFEMDSIVKFCRSLKIKYHKEKICFQNEKLNLLKYTDKSPPKDSDAKMQPMISQLGSVIQFNLILKIEQECDILVKCKINANTCAISFHSTLLRNHCVYSLQQKSVAIYLSRKLIDYNSLIAEGSFHVRYPSFEVVNCLDLLFTRDKVIHCIKNPLKFEIEIFDKKLKQIQSNWIFIMKELIQSFDLGIRRIFSRGRNPILVYKKSEKLISIESNLRISHYDPPSLSSYKSFNQKRDEEQKVKKRSHSQHNCASLHQDLKKVLSIISAYDRDDIEQLDSENFDSFSSEEIKALLGLLDCSKLHQKCCVYSEIIIETICNKIPLKKTLFSKIQLWNVKAKRSFDENVLTLNIVNKVSAKKNGFANQLEILESIKDQNHLFLPLYHFSRQPIIAGQSGNQSQLSPISENNILMEYLPDGDMSWYLNRRSYCISPISKIYLLYQITFSLRFLRDFNIVHKDLKPNNIMIKLCYNDLKETNMLAKLIDFGESIHPGNKSKKLGSTVPYASPEDNFFASQQFSPIDQKTDVFSLGIMFLEIVFGLFPPQPLRLAKSIYKENEEGSYDYLRFYSVPIEQIEKKGPTEMYRLLHALSLKCIDPNPNRRPTLNWLNIIFKRILIAFS